MFFARIDLRILLIFTALNTLPIKYIREGSNTIDYEHSSDLNNSLPNNLYWLQNFYLLVKITLKVFRIVQFLNWKKYLKTLSNKIKHFTYFSCFYKSSNNNIFYFTEEFNSFGKFWTYIKKLYILWYFPSFLIFFPEHLFYIVAIIHTSYH
jgi:hypothetical protein